MKNRKAIKIAVLMLAVLVLAGLIWHSFTRGYKPERLREDPDRKTYVYLYPTEEIRCTYQFNARRGCSLYVYYDAEQAKTIGLRYEDYTVLPDGTATSEVFGNKVGRFGWYDVYQVTYPDADRRRAVLWLDSHTRREVDLTEGWCVPGEETEAFLRDILPKAGLNETEAIDLINAWLPELEGNAYNRLSFCMDHTPLSVYKVRTDNTGFDDPVTSTLRVFLITQPLDEPMELTPQTFEPFERTGFTVIQWGGITLNQEFRVMSEE